MLLHVAKKVTEQTKGLKNELRKLKVRLHEIRFSEEEKRTTMRIASHEERAAKKSVRASILMKKVAQLQIGKNQNLLRIAISKKQTEQLLLAYRKGYQNIVRMNLEASENKLLYLEEKQRYLQAFASKKILRPGLEGLAYFDRDPRTPQKLVERINNMSRGIFGMLRWVIVMLAPRNERATAFRVYKTLIMSLRKLQLNRAYLQKELTKRNPFTTQCHPRSVINHCQKLTSTNQKQKLFGLLQSLRCCFIQRKSSFKPNLHIYFGINRRVPLCSWKDWRLTKRNKRWYLQGRFKYRLHFGDSKQQDKPGFLSVEDLADNGRSHYYVMPGYTYLLAEGSGHIGKMSFFLLPPKSPYSRMGHKNKVWHTIRRKELRKVQESLAGAIILKTAFDELFSGGSERISIYPAGGMWVLGISVRIKHGMLQKLMKKTNGKTAKAIQIMKKKFLSCGQGAKFRFKLGVFRSPLR
jgi:hypothetical protein